MVADAVKHTAIRLHQPVGGSLQLSAGKRRATPLQPQIGFGLRRPAQLFQYLHRGLVHLYDVKSRTSGRR